MRIRRTRASLCEVAIRDLTCFDRHRRHRTPSSRPSLRRWRICSTPPGTAGESCGLYAICEAAWASALRAGLKEAKASEQLFRQRVRKVIRGSYSNHYRRMLPRLLAALEFRCSNSAYRPVMDALELLHRHVDTPGQQRFYAPGDHVPIAGVVPDDWRQAVIDEHGKVERIPYGCRHDDGGPVPGSTTGA